MCDIEPEEFAEYLLYVETARAKATVRRQPDPPERTAWPGRTAPTAAAEA